MNKQIIVLLILLSVSIIYSCSIIQGKSIDWRYISSVNRDNFLTIIQYLDYRDNTNSAYYVMKGKVNRTKDLPKDNYLKLAINTEPLWVFFKDDGSVEILYGMGKMLENKLIDNTMTINRFLRDEEFTELTKGEPDRFVMVYFNEIE